MRPIEAICQTLFGKNKIIGVIILLFVVQFVAFLYRMPSEETRNAHPNEESIRAEVYSGKVLKVPYAEVAQAFAGADASSYIRAGLSFADGHGIYIKTETPTGFQYVPLYFWAPGTPFVIGIIIALFGQNSVFPYYVFIAIVHWLTAVFVVLTALRFVKSRAAAFLAGLVTLFTPSVVNYNYAIGLFMGEPLAGLGMAIGFWGLGIYWERLQAQATLKSLLWPISVFAVSLTAASYTRDLYGAFLIFTCLLLIVYLAFHRQFWKPILLGVVTSLLLMNALQFPWKMRNKALSAPFALASSSNGAVWRYGLWMDSNAAKSWCGRCGLGFGHYLDPEAAKQVNDYFEDHSPKKAIRYSIKTFLKVLAQNPLKAFMFKARIYDELWWGSPTQPWAYGFNILATLSLLLYLGVSRFRFSPVLWAFPLFLAALSLLIHYEHRYSQPFLLLVTPITLAFCLDWFCGRLRNSHSSSGQPINSRVAPSITKYMDRSDDIPQNLP